MRVEHTFFLPIKPNASQRSRCACRGRFPNVYTDPKYRAWKDEAVEKLKEIASFEDFREVSSQPVRVSLLVRVERPKTTKRAYPRGDQDNYEKGLFDAITQSNGWWDDDDQIIRGSFEKRWAEPGETEGYLITVEFLD